MAATEENWIITLSHHRPIEEVAEDIKDAGFQIDRILRTINVILARGELNALANVRLIVGVTDVSRDHRVRLTSRAADFRP